MRRISTLASLFALCAFGLAVAGCGDSHEKVVNDLAAQIEKVVGVLKGVTDKASADAAKPKLDSIDQDIKAIAERAKKLPKPSQAEEAALKSKLETRMKKAGEELQTEMMRVGPIAPELGGKVMEIMMNMAALGEK
jgi:acetylornithine/succinyldiaminopimelate/putrescine aminotransferase